MGGALDARKGGHEAQLVSRSPKRQICPEAVGSALRMSLLICLAHDFSGNFFPSQRQGLAWSRLALNSLSS